MAAAVTLAEQDISATVFEAAEVLGGRARRVEYRGVALDNGLHVLIGAYRETLRLIALVAEGQPPKINRFPFQWRIADRFHLKAIPLAAPLNLILGLQSARGASLAEKIRSAQFLARALRRPLPCDISVSELLSNVGQNLRQFFWQPLCVAALNTPPEHASARIFLNVLREAFAARSASDLLVAGEDLSRLFPERAAAYLARRGASMQLRNPVAAVRKTAGGFEFEAARGSQAFAHVICATPPYAVSRLIAGFPELVEIRRQIDRFEYQPIYSIYLQYPEATKLDFPMLGMADGPAHWVFDRGALCGQKGLLAAVISARGAHEKLSNDDLALRVHAQLKTLLPDLPLPEWNKVIAEKRATFSCTPALERPGQMMPLKNFFLAGDYTASEFPGTIEAAVRSGIRCARLILGT